MPLRHSVLWPNRSQEYCRVEGDPDGLHFGAFIDEVLVCVASVYLTSNQARLRKFATDIGYQKLGIGSKMLDFIIHSLKRRELEYFWCDARESALGFYQRFGMQIYSERFYKADIAYFKVKVSL